MSSQAAATGSAAIRKRQAAHRITLDQIRKLGERMLPEWCDETALVHGVL